MADRVQPADAVRRGDTAAPRALRVRRAAVGGAALLAAAGLAVAAVKAAEPATRTPASPAPATARTAPPPTAPAAPAASLPATAAAASGASTAPPSALPKLDHPTVPAKGRQEALLTVTAFGRYSVRAESRQGTAIRVVDRMAGEIGAAGEAGHENGRLDLFLDRGDYKLVAESDAKGDGIAKLTAEPFRSRAANESSPLLVERKLVHDDLDDLQQVAYWMRLPARQTVRLEAAGRNLADLRLWRDGSWLEDVEPVCDPVQPVVGQPLQRCEIAAILPAGLYLLAAYGGAAQPWAEDAREHPFYLRWGYPRLAEAGRRRYTVSPFGEDWFEAPAIVNYARIELPQARPARLVAGWATPGQLLGTLPAKGQVDLAEVKKESVPPVAELHVTVKAADAATAAAEPSAQAAASHRSRPPSLGNAEGGLAAGAADDQTGDHAGAAATEGGAAESGRSGGTAEEAEGNDDAGSSGNPAGDPTANPAGAGNGAGAGDDATASEPEASGSGGATPPSVGGGEGDSGDAAAAGAAGAAGGDGAATSSGQGGEAGSATPEDQAAAGAASNGAAGAGASESSETSNTGAEADDANGADGANGGGDNAGGDSNSGNANKGDGGSTGAGGSSAAKDLAAPRLWLGVRGNPGQVYVLQQFEQRDTYDIVDRGEYWVGTVHSGDPRDSIDAAAILTSRPTDGSSREVPNGADAVVLDGQHAWARRFNLLAAANVFLDVKEKGRYEVLADSGARSRIEPFFTTRPEHYKEPPLAASGGHWDLDPGLYVLTSVPRQRGIVTLGVRPAGKFPNLLADAAGQGSPVEAAVRFAPLTLDPSRRYILHLNHQPGVEVGGVFRRWPVDLDDPLPLAQRPGETVSVAFTTATGGTLRAETDDGRQLEVSVDAGPWLAAAPVTPLRAATAGTPSPGATHQVQVRNPAGAPSAGTVTYSLWVEPAALAAAAPLPPLPAGTLAALPKFARLSPNAAQHLDLARGAAATFAVEAGKPGLYELETTGVLATAATLRTRTVTKLAAGRANGVGRNALVRQYLSEGDFQATVSVLGRSAGHLGVTLSTTQLTDGGDLRPDIPARLTLAAGEGACYRFDIAQSGDYRLLAMGLGYTFTGRIEDAAGWPIEPPNIPLDLSRHFEPGRYRLVLLPQPMASRAVTLLASRHKTSRVSGHGPHPLALGTPADALWQEPARPAATAAAGTADAAAGAAGDSAERQPDRWLFELPAAAKVTISLNAEMEGSLTRLDASEELGRVPPGRSLTAELPAGSYQLAVVCSRRNSLVRYRVQVSTDELVAGEERLLQAPATVAVAVGGTGWTEISSFAATDVRARLYAADGTLVADEDDRPDDWNFLISERLPAGRYRLEIESIGRPRAALRLGLRAVAETAERPLALPAERDHAVDVAADRVSVVPLALPREADALIVACRPEGMRNIGLGIEARRADGSWRLLGNSAGQAPRLAIALSGDGDAGSRYRLRLWSPDRLSGKAQLAVRAGRLPRLSERSLAHGTTLPLLAGVKPPLAAAVVELSHSGVVRLEVAGAAGGTAAAAAPGAGSWSAAGAPGRLLTPPEDPSTARIAAAGQRIWLLADAGGVSKAQAPRLRGERLALQPGEGSGLSVRLAAPDTEASFDLAATSAAGRAGAAGAASAAGQGNAAGPVMALATSPSGQPAVRIGESGEPGEPAGGGGPTFALAPRAAVAVALAPRQPVIQVWDGEAHELASTAPANRAGSDAGLPMEVRVFQLRFAAPAEATASLGVTAGNLTGITATRFQLPAGPKRIRLSLGAGQIAVLAAGDRVLSTHWQDGAPFEELLDDDARSLVLLHTSAGADPFSFEILARSAEMPELAVTAGAPFVYTFDRAGTVRLRIPTPPAGGPVQTSPAAGAAGVAYRVWTAGADREAAASSGLPAAPSAWWTAGDGSVSRSRPIPGTRGAGGASDAGSGVGEMQSTASAAGGWLFIQHGSGPVMAWQAGLLESGPGEPPGSGGAWQGPLSAAGQPVTPPASLRLAGRFAHFDITVREPVVLHLRAAVPGLTLLHRGAGATPEAVQIHPAGISLDTYLLPGATQIGLSSLGDADLGGLATLTTTPVTALAALADGAPRERYGKAEDFWSREGLGDPLLLPAGDSRYFSFHVASRRLVGWGAAADAERVSCRLLRADGSAVTPRPLSGGRVAALADLLQMAELESGDYLLVLSSPADAAPVRVRPVVVGLSLPDSGPPPEVIRQYMHDAGAFAATATAPSSGSHP